MAPSYRGNPEAGETKTLRSRDWSPELSVHRPWGLAKRILEAQRVLE